MCLRYLSSTPHFLLKHEGNRTCCNALLIICDTLASRSTSEFRIPCSKSTVSWLALVLAGSTEAGGPLHCLTEEALRDEGKSQASALLYISSCKQCQDDCHMSANKAPSKACTGSVAMVMHHNAPRNALVARHVRSHYHLLDGLLANLPTTAQ